MKRYYLSLLVVLMATSIFGQTDSLDILKFKNQTTKLEAISSARSKLMDYIIEKDKPKTKELFYEILLKLDNDYYIGLYPDEKMLLALWLEEYDYISSEVVTLDSAKVARLHTKVRPNEDQLYRVLIHTIEVSKDTITESINSSKTISLVDKDFLLLLLKSYVNANDKNFQSSINDEATKFLNDHPKCSYEDYVRNYIRYEFSPEFIYGMEFYGGASLVGSNTASYFNSAGYFGFGITWRLSKFQLNTMVAFGFSHLNSDIDYNNVTWLEGERAQLILPEISLEYIFDVTRKVKIAPIIGMGWFIAAPFEDDVKKNTELEDVQVNSHVNPLFGLEMRYDFSEYYYNNYFVNKPMYGFTSLVIRYTIQPVNFPSRYSDLNGLMQTIQLCINFGTGKTKRVY